jgi:hypothetical protein
VLVGVRQVVLDAGCESARGRGGGNGPEDGSGCLAVVGVVSDLAGPGSDLSEEPAWGCEPVTLESVVVPRCPPGLVTVGVIASSSMCR